MHSRHQHQFSLNVWAGIIDKFFIGPFFLDGKLTGAKHVDFLSTRLHEILEEEFQSMLDFVCGLCMMELRRILAEWPGNF